jgi:cob(I)alamin adenosyltransferase
MFGEPGLVQIYTGDGKGKTTAALGLVLRACGQGARVAIVQFMKGWDRYGELKSVQLLPNVTLVQTGRPDYVYRGKEIRKDYDEAERGLAEAKHFIAAGVDLLILDEINVALDYGLLKLEDVVGLVKTKPCDMELVLTGRNATKELLDLADLVTEMREVKHPYRKGVKARRGVEY